MDDRIGDYLNAMRGYVDEVLKDAFPDTSAEMREEAARDTVARAITYWGTQNDAESCFDNLEVAYKGGRRVSKVRASKESAGWLATIAKNAMMSRITREKGRQVAEGGLESFAQESVSPETLAHIDGVLYGDHFTPLQIDIRDNYLLGEESLKDIAERRGLKYTYVKLECSRLKAQIKRYLGVCDD